MWDELRIAPTDDPKTIRRAYAARLKALDPDRQPDAFGRLRDAFERALTDATRRRQGADADNPPAAISDEPPDLADNGEPVGDPALGSVRIPLDTDSMSNAAGPAQRLPEQVAEAQESESEVRDRALLVALDVSMRHRDAVEAAALYIKAAATGALSLRRSRDILEQLLAAVVDDPNFDDATFRDLARSFGWNGATFHPPGETILCEKLRSRILADEWYERLRKDSVAKGSRAVRRRAKIARLLLKRHRRWWVPRVDKAALRMCLNDYRSHRPWLSHRLDLEWIDWLDRRSRRAEIRSVSFYVLLLSVFLIQFTAVFVKEARTDGLSVLYLLLGPAGALFVLWLLRLLLTHLLQLLRA